MQRNILGNVSKRQLLVALASLIMGGSVVAECSNKGVIRLEPKGASADTVVE